MRVTRIFCLLITLCLRDVLCETYFAGRITELVSGECLNERKIDLKASLDEFFVCHAGGLRDIRRFFWDCKIETIMVEMCTKNSLKQCLTRFEDKLGTCLSQKHKEEFMDEPLTSLSRGLEYVCNDNGFRVKEIANNNTKHCLEKKSEEIRQCSQKYGNIQEKWFLRSFRSNTNCYTRAKWGTCVMDHLDDCTATREIVRGLLVAMIHSTPCKTVVAREITGLSSSIQIFASKFMIILPIYISFKI